jgi:hypothetical protein
MQSGRARKYVDKMQNMLKQKREDLRAAIEEEMRLKELYER